MDRRTKGIYINNSMFSSYKHQYSIFGREFNSYYVSYSNACLLLLSGILFSTRRYPNISSYMTHKTKVLLIPYILLSLLFSFLDPRLYDLSLMEKQSYLNSFFSSSDIHSNLNFLAMEFITIFYYGNPPNIVAPLWFVLTLYLISILFFTIHHILSGSSRGIIIYAICCLMAGWILNLYNLILPYCFLTVLTASFFLQFRMFNKK